jgi:hypothetical protein
MSSVTKYILAVAAVALTVGNGAYAHRPNEHSGAECYRNGHRLYIPDGLNYPRQAWASWGITCRAPQREGIEEIGTTAAEQGERPAEWCGWWMRQHLGGNLGPEYNVARNWLNVGHPLPGPRPGALGIQEHHVFQVVRVVGPDQVLAISGNDHNAVRTRIRSTSGVIGWRDVAEGKITSEQKDARLIRNSSAATRQVIIGTPPDGDY